MMRVSFKSFLQHATKRSEQLEGRINFTAATGRHKLHFDICKGSATPGSCGVRGQKIYTCMYATSMQQADPVPVPGAGPHGLHFA